MSPEDFKNISQGIQAISIAVAAIGGGIWTLFKLYSSQELDKSRAEAIKAKREVELKQGFEGSIDIKVGDVSSSGNVPVFIEALIENNSTETHTLDWDVFPLKIAQLEFDHATIDSKYRITRIAIIRSSSINPIGEKKYWAHTTTSTFLPKSKKTMSFFWECKKEGVYMFTISAPLPNSIAQYLHESDADKGIHNSKEKYENELDNYNHRFQFTITKIFQVPNKAFQRTSR